MVAERSRRSKELWKKAAKVKLGVKVKQHAYHAIKHQVTHRATEKVGMGIAEHAVEFLAEAMLRFSATVFHDALEMHAGGETAHGNLTLASRVWLAALRGMKLLVPIVGAFLISHVAHDDLHRVQSEREKRGWGASTLLLGLALAGDTLDLLAHVVIVACLLAESVVDHETLHRVRL